mgnify:CR=1 FL=1
MTVRDWFKKAQKENFAIGAFNADNLEIFKAILTAAKNRKSPVMIEFSPGEVSYFGLRNIVDLVVNAREEYKIPIFLNLDHAKKVEDCMTAIGQPGFDEIHFDGSDLTFEENIKEVKRVVGAAHSKGLLVEGEIDKVGGSSEVHPENIEVETLKGSYTDPKKAVSFVGETQIDIFAAVFGNVHGTFPNQPDLDINLLSAIRGALPNTFLSMHGGSGISAVQVKTAIETGKIVKINVNTELRAAYKDALCEKIGEEPNEYKIYKFADEIMLAVAAVVEGKIEIFGSSGKI